MKLEASGRVNVASTGVSKQPTAPQLASSTSFSFPVLGSMVSPYLLRSHSCAISRIVGVFKQRTFNNQQATGLARLQRRSNANQRSERTREGPECS